MSTDSSLLCNFYWFGANSAAKIQWAKTNCAIDWTWPLVFGSGCQGAASESEAIVRSDEDSKQISSAWLRSATCRLNRWRHNADTTGKIGSSFGVKITQSGTVFLHINISLIYHWESSREQGPIVMFEFEITVEESERMESMLRTEYMSKSRNHNIRSHYVYSTVLSKFKYLTKVSY